MLMGMAKDKIVPTRLPAELAAWVAANGGSAFIRSLVEAAHATAPREEPRQVVEPRARELATWRAFVDGWRARHDRDEVGMAQLHEVATLLPEMRQEVLGGGDAQSQKIRLGRALSRMRRRTFNGFRIDVLEQKDCRGRARYQLQVATPR